MKLKDRIKIGENVKLYYRHSWGYIATPNAHGTVESIKGMNGTSCIVNFTNGTKGYLLLDTKIERY